MKNTKYFALLALVTFAIGYAAVNMLRSTTQVAMVDEKDNATCTIFGSGVVCFNTPTKVQSNAPMRPKQSARTAMQAWNKWAASMMSASVFTATRPTRKNRPVVLFPYLTNSGDTAWPTTAATSASVNYERHSPVRPRVSLKDAAIEMTMASMNAYVQEMVSNPQTIDFAKQIKPIGPLPHNNVMDLEFAR